MSKGKGSSATTLDPVDNAAWIREATKPKRRCGSCNDHGAQSIRDILADIARAKAYAITIKQIYERVGQIHKGFCQRVGFDAFRVHVANHESDLWKKAKGRDA